MKASSINELKREFSELSRERLLELCMRLAKYRVENKELLTYMLFEAHDEDSYIENVKSLLSKQLEEMNLQHVHLAKKTIRKVLRTTNKYAKYSGNTSTELQLRLHYCQILKETGILNKNSQVLLNLYAGQVSKIKTLLNKLHEDLQADYSNAIEAL